MSAVEWSYIKKKCSKRIFLVGRWPINAENVAFHEPAMWQSVARAASAPTLDKFCLPNICVSHFVSLPSASFAQFRYAHICWWDCDFSILNTTRVESMTLCSGTYWHTVCAVCVCTIFFLAFLVENPHEILNLICLHFGFSFFTMPSTFASQNRTFTAMETLLQATASACYQMCHRRMTWFLFFSFYFLK